MERFAAPAQAGDQAGNRESQLDQVSHQNWKYVMRGPTSERALDTYHLIFAPTHACNLRCVHCYLPDHEPELISAEVALNLVNQWSDIVLKERGPFGGIFHVKGGEPFVVPYLSKIAERLIELKSLRFMLTTNGTIATSKAFKLLERSHRGLDGNLTVIVSLDGATAATHDELRGAGQFDVTTGFVRQLISIGINVFLNCVVHAGNINEMEAYLKLAREFRVAQVNFLTFVPKGFGKQMVCRQARHLTVHRVMQKIYDNGDTTDKEMLAGSIPHILRSELQDGRIASHECVAGYRGLLYIKPDGSTYTCPNLDEKQFSVGNVKTDSLMKICDRLAAFHRSLRADGANDRYLCTGERLRYQNDKHLAEKLSLLTELQHGADENVQSAQFSAEASTAYCVSRNF